MTSGGPTKPGVWLGRRLDGLVPLAAMMMLSSILCQTPHSRRKNCALYTNDTARTAEGKRNIC